MHPHGEEAPITKNSHLAWNLPLQSVDDENDDEDDEDGTSYTEQHFPTEKRQSEDRSRKNEEHSEEINECEPTVLGRLVAQGFCHGDGDVSHEGDRIPDEDSHDVEEQVAHGDLHGVAQLLRIRGESGEDGRHSRSDVRSESEWVHALDVEDAHSHQWSDGGSEDGAALNEDGHACSECNGDVTGEEAAEASGKVCVEKLSNESRDLPLKTNNTHLVQL